MGLVKYNDLCNVIDKNKVRREREKKRTELKQDKTDSIRQTLVTSFLQENQVKL